MKLTKPTMFWILAGLLHLSAGANLRTHGNGQPALVASANSTCAFLQASVSALVRAEAGTGGAHKCPVELKQTAYFDTLHTALVKGTGPLQGCLDESSQEYYVKFFKDELSCLFATMVKDKCGSLKSKFDKRQVPWETMCLDPEKDLLDTYDLMDAAEKKYFFKVKNAAKEREIYSTYLKLAGDKELLCIFMKAVDDECANGLAFSKPRMKPVSFWKKKLKLMQVAPDIKAKPVYDTHGAKPAALHSDAAVQKQQKKLLPIGEGAYQDPKAVVQRTTDKHMHCEDGHWNDCYGDKGDFLDGHSYGNHKAPPKPPAHWSAASPVTGSMALMLVSIFALMQ